MSVGLLIITHGEIGRMLLHTATHMLGVCPLETRALKASFDCDPDAILATAIDYGRELDTGMGVLILTDMYGSTPSNIATRVQQHVSASVVSGVNLPMLVRVLNYPRLSLPELEEKALSGGRDGVLLCHPQDQ